MKKKNLIWIGLIALIALTGCSSKGSSSGGGGFFHHTFIEPFIQLIHATADLFGGSYGIAIIVITLFIRLILSPLMLRQYRNQNDMKEKMDKIKPRMTEIQKKIKATKDQTKQRELQQEMMALYRENGVNPLNMGCLPLVIQMPILMAFYYAIRGNQAIASHNFLWFSLGQPDIVLTILAGAVYFFQFRVQQSFMPSDQAGQMKWMGLMSPVMIMFVSFRAPAALPLYWSVGGLFLILQTVYAQKVILKDKNKAKSSK